MHFELTKIDGDVVHGVVHGLGDENDAHRYMAHPPTMPCQENLCPVESWVAKDDHAALGLEPGAWIIAFRVRDPAIFNALRSDSSKIEVVKDRNGLIEFNITNVKKCCAKVKKMSNTTEIEEFNRLVSACMGEIRKSATAPKNQQILKAMAETEISRERPDLARAIINEERVNALLPQARPMAPISKQVDDTSNPRVKEFNRLVTDRMGEIHKSATAPRDQMVLKAMAEAEISRERPDLARAVINEERAASMRQMTGV